MFTTHIKNTAASMLAKTDCFGVASTWYISAMSTSEQEHSTSRVLQVQNFSGLQSSALINVPKTFYDATHASSSKSYWTLEPFAVFWSLYLEPVPNVSKLSILV